MLDTKYADNNFFEYIDPWGEPLSSRARVRISSDQCTIWSTPAQAVYGRYIIFKFVPVVYWSFITDINQQQVNIDNVNENAKQVRHDYAIGYLVYVDKTGA